MRTNRLLRALTPSQNDLLGTLEPVTFVRGERVYVTEQPVTSFVFLTSGLVSLVRELSDGSRVTVWSDDGVLIGGQTVFQVSEPTYDAVMRTDGAGWRIARRRLAAAMRKDRALRQLILDWVHYMDTAISISAACVATHSIEQRLCRLLLDVHAAQGERVDLSIPEIAGMLPGARRRVYLCAERLQIASGIQMARRSTVIINAAVLEARVCGCFAAIRSAAPDVATL